MTSPPDDTTTDTSAIIVALRTERDAALAQKATLADELAVRTAELALRTAELSTRSSEYGERIGHQSATIDVLKAMSASPGDPQPVFDLIVEHASKLCNSSGAGFLEFDGERVHYRSAYGGDPAAIQAYAAIFPMTPTRASIACRAILDKQIIHIRDMDAELEILQVARNLGMKSNIALPLMRDGAAIGVLTLTANESGGFSDSQVALLQTFAEQLVIAITSAETYRALQTRTTDLQQSLEYQTATSDVLKVISRSTFDLQPVLDTVVETAARLCNAEQAVMSRREGEFVRLVANFGFPPEYEAHQRAQGLVPIDRYSESVGLRTIAEDGRIVHVHDVAAVPNYPEFAVRLGRQRTSLGVPLMREGQVIGAILLARQRVEPFTNRQIELVSTFADQAVIAMENTRLITEQQEALERQTATAEVLQVINATPGNLAPVFDAVLERALRLCGAAFGMLGTYDGTRIRWEARLGGADRRRGVVVTPEPGSALERVANGQRVVHIPDLVDTDAYRNGIPSRVGLVERSGARAGLWVALRKDDTVLGVILIYRREPRAFSEKQIALLESFAAQAVIAMENARLINEQREALEQQTATAEVLQVINASPGNLAPVFDAMLEKAMRLSGAAYGVLRSYDGEHLHMLASRGVPTEYAEFLARSGGPGTPGDRPMPGTAPMRALETRQPAQRLDVRESIGYTSGIPATRAIADLGGARTCLHVPLVKDQVSVGLLTFYRQEVRAFSDKQIALLQNFAAQAVIAMENARLLTEQREALEQQTATAEVLRVINASPGNLAPVFDSMLEKATRLCQAAFGVLWTYDGQRFHAAGLYGVSPAFSEFLRAPVEPVPGGTFEQLLAGEAIAEVIDIAASEIYRTGTSRLRRAFVDLGGAQTVLFVALRKDDVLLGAFSIYREQVGPFSEKQTALVTNFAAQAVIAMENARLLTEQQEALEQQTATAEVLQVINASPGNLTPVFDAMLEKALDLCGAAFGVLWTFDGEQIHAVAHRGVSPEFAEYLTRTPHPVGPDNAHGRLLAGESVVHIVDVRADKAYQSGDPLRRTLVELGGGRTLLAVPLRKDETFLGDFVIYRLEVRPFSDKQIALLENFAAQAVIAMENARLLDEIRRRQEELRVTFENMGDGVAMFDETPRLVAWNRKFQEIFDVPGGLLGEHRTYVDYVRYLAERGDYGPRADAEEHVRGLVEQAGQSRTYERTRPDGRVIEIRHNPVPGGGFVLIYADITERKRSEAEIHAARDAAEEASRTIEAAYRDLKAAQANLIQAEKMASLGQLTAGIAHEIKNPLNFVNNFSALSTELIDELRDVLAPEPLGETARTEVDDLTALLKGNLEKVVQHGQRADGIVKAMLEHSRGSSGERRMVDLNALIDEALNLAYHGARAQDQSFNIALERDFGEGIATIEVNPQDITRVFLNLFANGFYATTRRAHDGGDAGFEPTLKVITRDAGEAVEIRVRDNGTGIPTDIRDKLFQPFFTTKPTGEGTGLGLSITYDIVTQQHGGSIAVDSKVGEYSEFTIQLPRKP